MALIPLKSLSRSCALDSVAEDHKASRRVEQFRVGSRAVYFPAFPGDRYLPYAAVEKVRSKNTAISVIGTCGKQIPMVLVRLHYDGEFYKDFLFEKRMKVDEILDLIRERRPDLEMDVAAPSRMLDR